MDGIESFTGIDVDTDAIAWCRDNLPGSYFAISFDPPTGLERDSVDLVLALSVFSHMSEEVQLAWLAEVHRLLRPGALFFATTHSESLTYTRPDLRPDQHLELGQRGFLFAPGTGPFNDDGAFHTREYLTRTWGEHFTLVAYKPKAIVGFQDLSIWRKRERDAARSSS